MFSGKKIKLIVSFWQKNSLKADHPWPSWTILLALPFFGPISTIILIWKNLKIIKQNSLAKKFLLTSIGIFLIFFTAIYFYYYVFYISQFERQISEPNPVLELLGIASYYSMPYYLYAALALPEYNYLVPLTTILIPVIALLWYYFFQERKQQTQPQINCRILPWLGLSFVVFCAFMGMWITLDSLFSTAPQPSKPPQYNDNIRIAPTPSPGPTPTYQPAPFYIELLNADFSDEPFNQPSDHYYETDGQPKFFDPHLHSYTPVDQPQNLDVRQRNYYSFEGEEYNRFMAINGALKDEDAPIKLIPPYKLDYYAFGRLTPGCAYPAQCASYVLDISKNNQRIFLFNHVISFKVSPDKKRLLIQNYEKIDTDQWQIEIKIINLATQVITKLPNTECTYQIFGWENDKFITLSDSLGSVESGRKICIWDKNGRILHQIKGVIPATMGRGLYFGILPNNPNVFYSTTLSKNQRHFLFVLQDLTNQENNRVFRFDVQLYSNVYPWIEVDLKNLNLATTELRYRFENYEYYAESDGEKTDDSSPKYVEELKYSEWKIAEEIK